MGTFKPFKTRHAGYAQAIHFWVCRACRKDYMHDKPAFCEKCGASARDGLWHFDSKAEFLRFRELELMERARVISGLDVHPRYDFTMLDMHGKPFHACTYEADFVYTENGVKVVEDVKPRSDRAQSDSFKQKKVWFEKCYKIKLTITHRG